MWRWTREEAALSSPSPIDCSGAFVCLHVHMYNTYSWVVARECDDRGCDVLAHPIERAAVLLRVATIGHLCQPRLAKVAALDARLHEAREWGGGVEWINQKWSGKKDFSTCIHATHRTWPATQHPAYERKHIGQLAHRVPLIPCSNRNQVCRRIVSLDVVLSRHSNCFRRLPAPPFLSRSLRTLHLRKMASGWCRCAFEHGSALHRNRFPFCSL